MKHKEQHIQASLQAVLLLPLTTQFRPAFASMRLKPPAWDCLVKYSYVMVEQVRVADRGRSGVGPLARLTAEEMAAMGML